MGNHYANVTVVDTDAAAVLEALAGDAAAVLDAGGGRVVAFVPMGSAAPTASRLSEQPGATALSVEVYDDDMLLVGLHRDGAQVHAYRSMDDFLEGGDPVGADPAPFVDSFDADAAQVQAVLGGERPVFETERHSALVDVLGLPDQAVSWGWEYLDRTPSEHLPAWAADAVRTVAGVEGGAEP